eukprot:scaffold8058_cov258-Pinguiococcus_pyrenoidosus.AAC.4
MGGSCQKSPRIRRRPVRPRLATPAQSSRTLKDEPVRLRRASQAQTYLPLRHSARRDGRMRSWASRRSMQNLAHPTTQGRLRPQRLGRNDGGHSVGSQGFSEQPQVLKLRSKVEQNDDGGALVHPLGFRVPVRLPHSFGTGLAAIGEAQETAPGFQHAKHCHPCGGKSLSVPPDPGQQDGVADDGQQRRSSMQRFLQVHRLCHHQQRTALLPLLAQEAGVVVQRHCPHPMPQFTVHEVHIGRVRTRKRSSQVRRDPVARELPVHRAKPRAHVDLEDIVRGGLLQLVAPGAVHRFDEAKSSCPSGHGRRGRPGLLVQLLNLLAEIADLPAKAF